MKLPSAIEKLLGTPQSKRDAINARQAEITSTIAIDRRTIEAFDADPIGTPLESVDPAQRRLASYTEIEKTFDSIAIENRFRESDDRCYNSKRGEFEKEIADWLTSREKPRADYRKLVGAEVGKRQARKYQETLSDQAECDLDDEITKLNEDSSVRDSFLTAAKNKLVYLSAEPSLENFKSALCAVNQVDFTTAPTSV
ncbi:MAG: hypothetical protein ABI600_21305 [Luteolibacter sp.]